MKTAYELAMERLNKTSPAIKLTDTQKAEIAELESKYKAKLAEREIALKEQITTAAAEGDLEKTAALEKELANERKKLQAEFEQKKEKIWHRK